MVKAKHKPKGMQRLCRVAPGLVSLLVPIADLRPDPRNARTPNHAKLLCFDMTDGRKFVAHGSLNLRRCNAYEQVVLSHDGALHTFFRDFIEECAAQGGLTG